MNAIGPDFIRQVFPPEIRERLSLMHAWALRMVLAALGGQPDALADYAQRIATYDDDPVRAASPYAGKFPGTRYTFAVEQAMELTVNLLDAAHQTGNDLFTNAQVLDGTRNLISDLVPAEHQDAVLAVADTMPATGELGGWPLAPEVAGLAELYFVTVMAAWFCRHPQISPSRPTIRRYLLERIHSLESTARGVPELERLDVTEQQALDLLDSLLGGADFTAVGVSASQGAVNRDRSKRTLLELDIVETAKAHLIEHPIRTEDTDRKLMDDIRQALAADLARSRAARPPTKQRRTAKQKPRQKRRSGGKRKRRR